MILKHILTNMQNQLPPLHINHVKQYTKFKVGEGTCFFSCENFIAHPFLWVFWEMFHRKKIVKKMDFGAFFVYFNIILPKKCSLLTYE